MLRVIYEVSSRRGEQHNGSAGDITISNKYEAWSIQDGRR